MIDNEFGYIEDGKVFRRSFRNFPDRQIGEIKTDGESSIAYFKERFQVAEKKVEELENAVLAAENKGSYLMKLIHLKEYLINIDAIGDFEALFTRLERLEVELNKLIAANRINNLEAKRALLKEAEEYKGSSNWKEDTEKLKDIKNRWIKTGNVEKEFEKEIEQTFSSIVDDFFTRRQEYYQAKHRLVQNKLAKLKQLVERAKVAADKPSQEAKQALKSLQAEWREVGKAPGNLAKSLYSEFRTINDKVFQSGATGHYTQNRNLGATLKEKEEIVLRVQKLAKLPSPLKSHAEEVKTFLKGWKNKGSNPKDQNRLLTESFYSACNLVLEKYFIVNLARGRHENFDELSEKDQLQIKLQLTKDLLSRDLAELELFQNNLEKFNANTATANKMVNAKLSQQTRKVHIKKVLLREFENELKKK